MEGGRSGPSAGALAREGIVYQKHPGREASEDRHEKRDKRDRSRGRHADHHHHQEVKVGEVHEKREKRGGRRKHKAKSSDNATSIDLEGTSDLDVSNARPPPLPPSGPPAPAGVAPPPASMSLKQRAYGSSGGPPAVRPPHAIVPQAFANVALQNHVASTGSLGYASNNSNNSANNSMGGSRAGSGASDAVALVSITGDTDYTPRRGAGSSSPTFMRPNQVDLEPLSTNMPLENMSMEELRLQNLSLQREVEQVRDRLLQSVAGRSGTHGANANQRVVGGGFRGSSIRTSDKRGSDVTEKEVETLRQVAHQKNAKITQLEDLLKAMKADAQSQERSLNQLQSCLSDSSEQLASAGAQRQALERKVEELTEQLVIERRRNGQAEKHAEEAAAGKLRDAIECEELNVGLRDELQEEQEALSKAKIALSNTRNSLQVKSRACTAAEGRAACLEARTSELTEAEAAASQKLRGMSEVRLAMTGQYLAARGFRHSVLRLCWEAWNQRTADRCVVAELNRLRSEVEEAAAQAELRSAAGSSEHAELNAELLRLQASEAAVLRRLQSSEEEAAEEQKRAREAAASARQAATEEVQSEVPDTFDRAELTAQAAGLEAQLRSRELELKAAEESELALATEASHLRDENSQLCLESSELLQAARGTEKLECELSELRGREGVLSCNCEEFENQLRQAKVVCEAQDALSREALLARDASVAREAALKTRAADLERRLEAATATPATSSTAPVAAAAKRPSSQDKAAAAAAAAAEKQKQQLQRDMKTAERERDEVRKSLQLAEQRVARLPELEREVAAEQRLTGKLKGDLEELKSQQEQLKNQQSLLETEAQTQVKALRERGDSAASEASASMAQASEQATGLRNEMTEMKSEFGLASVDVRRLRQAREELRASLKVAQAEASSSTSEAKKWKEAAAEAVKQVQSSLRILVTAPKVSINIGNSELNVQRGSIPNDVEQIRSIVSERVLPAFQRIMAIAEGEDEKDVRGAVMRMVEELAEKVQQEVYHVLPQAEGTASWDGFGARASSLR